MAECILMKNGGGVGSDELTASASNVLSGKTYVGSDTNDDIGTGIMPNNGAISKTFTPTTSAQEYTVPLGYHSGSGKVKVNATPTQTKTAYATTSAQTITPDSGKFLSSVSVGALSQANLSAANIKKGVNVRIANGSANVYNVTGTLAYTPHMADFQKRFPDRNWDYDVTWTVPYTGMVYFSWSFSSNGTSGYFVYRNGTKISSDRSGSFEVAMTAGQTIRWGYRGAHEVSDDDGSVYMITMTMV